MNTRPDCIVIGYNELPFKQYEHFLRSYGEDSEAYRDLKFSFVNIDNIKLDYPGLLNYAMGLSQPTNADNSIAFKSGDIPNLAAVYLTNFMRRRGMNAQYINLFQYEKERLEQYLREDPVCVAITTTFYVVNLPVCEIVEYIRKYNNKTKIVVGGPLVANHARNYPDDALTAALGDMGADIYVIEGAGELALFRIVTCLKNNGSLADVPNLAYWEKGQLIRTAIMPESNSLDENSINWLDFADQSLGSTIQTRTARSCAFNCAFCNYPTRAGKLALASTDTVEKELSSMRALGGVKNVVFIDDTFNVPLPRFKELCRMMIRNNFGFNWFSYFRCSNSDDEAFDLMAQSGCKGVFLGIESGSPSILKNMNKAATVEKYAYGIKRLHQQGILTFASFIMGFPGETQETVNETAMFIKEHKPTYYRAQNWYCEPGTPIDRRREEFGINGEGFVWRHKTMDSVEAMNHIERLFLSVSESLWLPQWSFDFWIIPYLIGRGISVDRFKEFMTLANRFLASEIAYLPAAQKKTRQRRDFETLVNRVRAWNLGGTDVPVAAH
jgi:radical SAM PhpK family P-methyltransferase